MISYCVTSVAAVETTALPPRILAHVGEKNTADARAESIAAYRLLAQIGRENAVPDILSRLSFDGGRPATDGIYVSLSHAGGLVAAAIADRPVGIDVEPVRPLPRMEALAARYFSEEENAALCAVPSAEKEETFFRIFTKKEAYAKANGISLAETVRRDLSAYPPYAQKVVRDEKSGILYAFTVILCES